MGKMTLSHLFCPYSTYLSTRLGHASTNMMIIMVLWLLQLYIIFCGRIEYQYIIVWSLCTPGGLAHIFQVPWDFCCGIFQWQSKCQSNPHRVTNLFIKKKMFLLLHVSLLKLKKKKYKSLLFPTLFKSKPFWLKSVSQFSQCKFELQGSHKKLTQQ